MNQCRIEKNTYELSLNINTLLRGTTGIVTVTLGSLGLLRGLRRLAKQVKRPTHLFEDKFRAQGELVQRVDWQRVELLQEGLELFRTRPFEDVRSPGEKRLDAVLQDKKAVDDEEVDYDA